MFPANTQQYVRAPLASAADTEAVNTRYTSDSDSVAAKVCRVCLAMSRKLYHMSEHQLSIMYERVTGVVINTEDKLPKMLCWECVARLSSAINFIEKALKTQWLLVEKFDSNSNVTLSDIESIDKAHYNIRSTLGCKVIIENDPNAFKLPENYESKDFYEYNGIDISNEGENMITEVNVITEKDPIKIEYLDVIDEQNVSGGDYKKEDINHDKDSIKKEYLDVTDREYKKIEKKGNDIIFEVPIDNIIHRKENRLLDETKHVCEEIKMKKIRSKVTPLRKRRREALSQYKELYAQNAFKHITAQSSDSDPMKTSGMAGHPQIKREMSEEDIYLEKITTNIEKPDSDETSNTASVSTATVDSEIGIREHKEHIVDIHAKDGVFTCNYCGYESNLKRRLNMHINTMHTKNISFNCSLCTYKAYDKRTLTRHINAKHTKTNVYNCSLCSYNSYDKSNLTRHINNKHTKTNVYSCTFCSFTTFQQSNLNAHIRVKHTKTDVYKCSLCSYVSYDKRTLTKHVNAKHTETEVHNCPHCSFKTYLKGNLNQHINAKHTKAKVYNCDYCSFKTYQRGSLNVHVNAKHTKANVYTCDYCNFVTYQHGSLSIHVNAKHDKRIVYNCSLCSYESYRKSSLSAHVSTKHA